MALSFSNSTLSIPRILSLNLNSLSYYGGTSRHRRIMKYLRSNIKNFDTICLQETGLLAAEGGALDFGDCKTGLSNKRLNVSGVATIETPSLVSRYSVCTIETSDDCLRGHIPQVLTKKH